MSVYSEPDPADTQAVRWRRIVEHFMRQHRGPLAISHVILLEARDVYSESDRPATRSDKLFRGR